MKEWRRWRAIAKAVARGCSRSQLGRAEAGGTERLDRPRPAEYLDWHDFNVGVEHLLDFALANRADALFHHLAALEEQ